MSHVSADITLINGEDQINTKKHIIREDEIKKITVRGKA